MPKHIYAEDTSSDTSDQEYNRVHTKNKYSNKSTIFKQNESIQQKQGHNKCQPESQSMSSQQNKSISYDPQSSKEVQNNSKPQNQQQQKRDVQSKNDSSESKKDIKETVTHSAVHGQQQLINNLNFNHSAKNENQQCRPNIMQSDDESPEILKTNSDNMQINKENISYNKIQSHKNHNIDSKNYSTTSQPLQQYVPNLTEIQNLKQACEDKIIQFSLEMVKFNENLLMVDKAVLCINDQNKTIADKLKENENILGRKLAEFNQNIDEQEKKNKEVTQKIEEFGNKLNNFEGKIRSFETKDNAEKQIKNIDTRINNIKNQIDNTKQDFANFKNNFEQYKFDLPTIQQFDDDKSIKQIGQKDQNQNKSGKNKKNNNNQQNNQHQEETGIAKAISWLINTVNSQQQYIYKLNQQIQVQEKQLSEQKEQLTELYNKYSECDKQFEETYNQFERRTDQIALDINQRDKRLDNIEAQNDKFETFADDLTKFQEIINKLEQKVETMKVNIELQNQQAQQIQFVYNQQNNEEQIAQEKDFNHKTITIKQNPKNNQNPIDNKNQNRKVKQENDYESNQHITQRIEKQDEQKKQLNDQEEQLNINIKDQNILDNDEIQSALSQSVSSQVVQKVQAKAYQRKGQLKNKTDDNKNNESYEIKKYISSPPSTKAKELEENEPICEEQQNPIPDDPQDIIKRQFLQQLSRMQNRIDSKYQNAFKQFISNIQNDESHYVCDIFNLQSENDIKKVIQFIKLPIKIMKTRDIDRFKTLVSCATYMDNSFIGINIYFAEKYKQQCISQLFQIMANGLECGIKLQGPDCCLIINLYEENDIIVLTGEEETIKDEVMKLESKKCEVIMGGQTPFYDIGRLQVYSLACHFNQQQQQKLVIQYPKKLRNAYLYNIEIENIDKCKINNKFTFKSLDSWNIYAIMEDDVCK